MPDWLSGYVLGLVCSDFVMGDVICDEVVVFMWWVICIVCESCEKLMLMLIACLWVLGSCVVS